jgi:hypothetical protein
MMISDGETKGSSPHSEESHSFPLLSNSPINAKNDSSNSRGDCFKPLFNNVCMDGKISPHRGFGVHGSDDNLDSEDQVRRQGFERGFDAGKQDACSLVRQGMAPQVKSFADVFNRWNEIMIRAEENSNLQILKMAVSIAEKILGDAPQCGTGKLDALKTELAEMMRKAYHLELKLNPEDMDALSRLMGCENAHWDHWDYVTAAEDPEVPKGSVLVQPGPQTISADDEILLSLDAALAEPQDQKKMA